MTSKKKSIALFNDTGNYPHIGCRAVSDSHDALLSVMGIEVVYRHFVDEFTELWTGDLESSLQSVLKSGLLDELSSVDAVVVNGEGTIHHGHGLHLLSIVGAAQAIEKPTYIVNAVIQDIPIAGLKILAELKDLSVRDLFSHQYLQKMGIKSRLVADSIIGARFDEGVDNDFTNKILVTDCVVNKTNAKLLEVVKHFGSDAVYFPLEGQNAHNWQGTLKKIRGCRLMVTGRHHGLYLALMAKVPFVALSSNTWKIEGTLAALQHSDTHNKKESLRDILGMCNAALENPSAFERVFSHPFISNPLSTFSVLAKDLGLTASDLCVEAINGCDIDRFYENRWDFYWRNNLESKAANGDQKSIADRMLLTCGLGRTLDVGSGVGRLVSSLLRSGVDAYGVDVSETATSYCNRRMPGRFTQGSVLALPFEDASFETVVSTDCMEHLAPEDVPKALKEIHRVASRFVFLQLATTQDRDGHWHLTVEGRAWWEAKCFAAGFRKHPAYYKVNPYESLNEDGWQIMIVLEKIPEHAHKKHPLSALVAERDLGMDMLREVGERSDAHVARYIWAERFVRQGDRVLDAACGLGYGSYTLAELSKAKSIIGIDGSDYAIDYARANFLPLTSKLDFGSGYLPSCLEKYPDGYFDVIVSFETLEHVAHPEVLLMEFHRLLSPGGRIVVCVPNDWSDETGEASNPFHLHVYNLDKLRAQIKQRFILEALAQQIASGCKTTSAWNSWQRMPRALRNVSINTDSPPPSEWWLMVGMKDPVSNSVPYRESVYGYSVPPNNLLQFERDYKNPWLVRSLLEFQFRATNNGVLKQVALRVLAQESDQISADKGAALAVLGYQLLANDLATSSDVDQFLEEIELYITAPQQIPHLQRFHVSLAYLRARLLVKIGRFEAALAALKQVANADLSNFSPTLGTKVVDAAFEAGLMFAGNGDIVAARDIWKLGVERAYALLSSDVGEFIGDINNPHEFPTIVAVEFLDSAVRCIKALRITTENSFVPLTRLYELTRENWKGMLEERWTAMQSMEELIRARDNAIAEQSQMLEKRWTAMQSMEELIRARDNAIAEQSQMLEERWTAMQSMEELIRERDRAIAGQATMLEERWAVMQSMEELIRERDRAIAGQATMLEERWAAMQSMEELIRARDNSIAGQSQMLEERWTAMQSMEELIQARDEVIKSQKEKLDSLPSTTEALKMLCCAILASLRHRFSHAFGRSR